MGSTRTINAAPGRLPADASVPVAWGAPNAIARIPWTTSAPMKMDLEIQGLQTFGNYTPPAIAVVEHYDPFKKAMVREFIDIGGTVGPTPIPVVVGLPPDDGRLSMGEVKIAIYNVGGSPFRAGAPKGLGAVSKVGGVIGNILSAINGVAESPNFAVTNIRSADVDLSNSSLVDSLRRSVPKQIIQQFDPDGDGNRGSSPAGSPGDAPSSVRREPPNHKGSAAPDGPASTSIRGTASTTPAFQPDAVYSPARDFFGNFPRASAVAATPSPTAFKDLALALGRLLTSMLSRRALRVF